MTPLKVFACYNASLNIRLASSSGAIFFPIAQYILSKQGIVYGVSMSEDCYSAEFISVTEISELSKLQGSKYLQAKLGNTFQKVQKNLQTGRMVLFSGTGCQINGLKSFLRKDYENLLCIDLICHGADLLSAAHGEDGPAVRARPSVQPADGRVKRRRAPHTGDRTVRRCSVLFMAVRLRGGGLPSIRSPSFRVRPPWAWREDSLPNTIIRRSAQKCKHFPLADPGIS